MSALRSASGLKSGCGQDWPPHQFGLPAHLEMLTQERHDIAAHLGRLGVPNVIPPELPIPGTAQAVIHTVEFAFDPIESRSGRQRVAGSGRGKVRPWSDNAVGRPAQVYEVEPLGGYTVVTVDAGATRLRALVRGQSAIRPEASVAISCEASRVHYFNAAGDAIAR